MSEDGFAGLGEVVVLDIETTGLKPDRDRVVSIAMIKANLSKVSLDGEGKAAVTLEILDEVFDPQIKIPAAASRINGFTNASVAGKPSFAEKAQDIREFIGELPIIAHNVEFDGSFLDAEFERAGIRPITRNRRLCTMREVHRRAKIVQGNDVKWPKLVEAGRYAGVSIRQSAVHNALEDTQNVFQLAIGLKNTDITDDGQIFRTDSAAVSWRLDERKAGARKRMAYIGAFAFVVLAFILLFQ